MVMAATINHIMEDGMTTSNSIPAINILHTDCFFHFDNIACIRNILLSVASGVTCLLCCIRILKLHFNHSQAYHHFIVFYIALISTLCLSINFVLGSKVHMHITMHFLKLLMLLVLTHFYWVLASRALRCEAAVRRIMHPALIAVACYYIVTVTVALVYIDPGESECLEPYWLLMSVVEVIMVQFFALAGLYITRRLNEISTLHSVRWAQKRNIWCIVVSLEISAIMTLIYDSTVQILGDKTLGCGAIFNYQQSLYSTTFAILMVVKLLGPIWIMLYAFQPNVVSADQEVTYPAYSEDGTYGSAYSDDSQYRQLYHPTDMYHSVNSFPDLITPSPGTLTPTPIGVVCDVRHGLPNPAMIRNSTATTILEPISEEGTSINSGKGSHGLLAAARNIPKEMTSSKAKCFNWLRSPSPGKIYL